MINPISDAVSDKRWWRENLGNLSLAQVISMIDNGKRLPWQRPIASSVLVVSSDAERLGDWGRRTGMGDRAVADSHFESDDDDMEDYIFSGGFVTRNWLRFHNVNLNWATEESRSRIGFRIVRNRS